MVSDDLNDYRGEVEAMLSLLEEVVPRIQQNLNDAILSAEAANASLGLIGQGGSI